MPIIHMHSIILISIDEWMFDNASKSLFDQRCRWAGHYLMLMHHNGGSCIRLLIFAISCWFPCNFRFTAISCYSIMVKAPLHIDNSALPLSTMYSYVSNFEFLFNCRFVFSIWKQLDIHVGLERVVLLLFLETQNTFSLSVISQQRNGKGT